MEEKNIQEKKTFLHKCRKLLNKFGLFLILLVLPALTIWTSFYYLQINLLKISRGKALDEMAEITANMLRKAEPETFFQESLRDLAEKFKWADYNDIERIGNKDILELALFDENGERLNWPRNENLIKIKPSQNYLAALKRYDSNPGTTPTSSEKKVAVGYSGNEATLLSLSAQPNTLVNFNGIGLRKMGGWYKIKFYTNDKSNNLKETQESETNKNEKTGDLLAWLNLEKLDKYLLANQTIDYFQKKTSPIYTFSYIDLKYKNINKSSYGRRFRQETIEILSSKSLKSSFIYNNELFSINDTKEGIRLICSRPSPEPLPLLKNYTRILLILLPFSILLFIWKYYYNINITTSIKTQAIFIFGFASLIGLITITINTISYQYEKKLVITQNYKNEAIDILEKIDQQFSDSFDDFLFQYRHIIDKLGKSKESPSEILYPLKKAQKDDIISYAVYIDKYGNVLFQAPSPKETGKSIKIADKYSYLLNGVTIQSLIAFNSSKNLIKQDDDSKSLRTITAKSVENLLSGRSKFIETKIDNVDTLAFMDFNLNEEGIAEGCLLIIHEPRKLERNYLDEVGRNISKERNFELIAFPKTTSDLNLYYPRYSYIKEEPLWKLNDIVNQTQLSSFKEGKISGKNVIVAALPAIQMKNYNLFLSIPLEKIADKTFSLSKVLLIGTTFSLILILFTVILITNSLSSPIKILKNNTLAIKKDDSTNTVIIHSENNEIESISSSLENLVLKAKGFEENKNICNQLIPIKAYNDSNYEIDAIQTITNIEASFITNLSNDIIFMCFITKNLTDDSINSTIPLVMTTSAAKFLVEDLGVRSPSICLKNIEEYFKINYKLDINANIIAIFLNKKTNTITYSSFGKIKLLEYDYSNMKGKIHSINNSDTIYFKPTDDTSLEIKDNSSIIVFNDNLSEDSILNLQSEIGKMTDNQLSLKENLETIISNSTNNKEHKIKYNSFLFVHRKKENKSAKLSQKIAEINPIAFIRSQKPEGQKNA